MNQDQHQPTPNNDDKWIEEFAKRHHRLHHLLWHLVRQQWPQLNPSQQAAIERLGWKPPRMALDFVRGASSRPLITNGSGEDFLFMHREMIELYRKLEGSADGDWVTVPQPGTAAGTPPPPWAIDAVPAFDRRMRALKADTHYWSRMMWWDRAFKDPTRLRTLTLGELGSLLEYSIHNDMHMRWASQPRDPETGEPLPMGRIGGDIRKKWDDKAYNYLGEFYSSHVHPDFWRLHGWVDARIADWFAAHLAAGHTVRRSQIRDTPWFAQGEWVVVAQPWSGAAQHSVTDMERVVAILFPAADAKAAAPAPALAATWFGGHL